MRPLREYSGGSSRGLRSSLTRRLAIAEHAARTASLPLVQTRSRTRDPRALRGLLIVMVGPGSDGAPWLRAAERVTPHVPDSWPRRALRLVILFPVPPALPKAALGAEFDQEFSDPTATASDEVRYVSGPHAFGSSRRCLDGVPDT